MHPLSVGATNLHLEKKKKKKTCPHGAPWAIYTLFPHLYKCGGQRGALRIFLSNNRICPTPLFLSPKPPHPCPHALLSRLSMVYGFIAIELSEVGLQYGIRKAFVLASEQFHSPGLVPASTQMTRSCQAHGLFSSPGGSRPSFWRHLALMHL